MNVDFSSEPISATDADTLLVMLFEGEQPGNDELGDLDAQLGGAIRRVVDLGDARGKLHETNVVYTPSGSRWPRVLLVGAGPRDALTTDRVRTVAGTAVRQAKRLRATRPAFWLRGEVDALGGAAAAAEGAVLATFDPAVYQTSEDRGRAPDSLTIVDPRRDRAESARAGVDRGTILGEATNFARGLANEPGNRLGPVELAEIAVKLASDVGLECEVLDERQLRDLGMNAMLTVAQGSDRPPRLIVLRYRAATSSTTLGLVGKAVTFDTGGISIKPAERMHEMKMDMCGGAAVLGAMRAIAQLKPPVDVLGIVGAVENMPSGHAMRPGDVVKAFQGKTIEILNTDAEGRLVLADAVAYAVKLGAARVVDAATLTGAVVVALGHVCAGLFGRPQEWVDTIKRSADVAGERLWQLPLYDEYRDQLKSSIADLANVGGRAAGSITGATFIGEFVERDVPWAHLDIAGTAWTDKDLPYLAKGPTGIGVRTFVHLAFQVSEDQ